MQRVCVNMLMYRQRRIWEKTGWGHGPPPIPKKKNKIQAVIFFFFNSGPPPPPPLFFFFALVPHSSTWLRPCVQVKQLQLVSLTYFFKKIKNSVILLIRKVLSFNSLLFFFFHKFTTRYLSQENFILHGWLIQYLFNVPHP